MARANARLEQMIKPAIDALGFELVGVEQLSQGRHSMLRIYIDHEDGITVDNCANVSRQVSAVLDVEDPIHGEYTLEVSSPGVERPLFTLEQFAKFIGQQVDVRLHMPVEGRRHFKGELLSVENDELTIELGEDESLTCSMDDIDRAKLIPKW
ncbi:MAG: ribosome maturation factor RimP [Gammaproteobacteria bacterium]|nr:ribosome maturation factor RimP [Gammaproteobacteria bacterium]MCW8982757.1 ribosome maturation factor RimP [Gammaproteobacteria bacterium]